MLVFSHRTSFLGDTNTHGHSHATQMLLAMSIYWTLDAEMHLCDQYSKRHHRALAVPVNPFQDVHTSLVTSAQSVYREWLPTNDGVCRHYAAG